MKMGVGNKGAPLSGIWNGRDERNDKSGGGGCGFPGGSSGNK